ncbi:MAG: 2Fe-2S iron-sulfur cluster binding domain-containing protein, partial [Acidimicrobiaceae bacterium]|nr:2Fe-2S iron-sulfur cluster binding domain-containing protein [Acidimicrobiaceae bacterium]MYI35057.1 2Fe-2S iron-sulfur cluster binding domain-containing protein [Acidimicrobiaceae bacterium]
MPPSPMPTPTTTFWRRLPTVGGCFPSTSAGPSSSWESDMELTVNSVARTVQSPPLSSLLTVLREELDITSPKAGCESGGCGACTVLVDGQPRRSCLTAVCAVDGAEVTTVEGLGTPEDLSRVQQAFIHHYA